MLVLLATKDGNMVDASVETAASLVRYRVTAEEVVFVDLVGRSLATEPRHAGPALDVGESECDLIVVAGEPPKHRTTRVPSMALKEPTSFGEVVTAIQARLKAAGGAGARAAMSEIRQIIV